MTDDHANTENGMTKTGRYLVLVAGCLGWGFAGVQMAITSIAMRVAVADLLPSGTEEGEIGKWFGWLVCAFLFGAATGGYLFGYIGDRIGRSKAMAASILCYSLFSALTYAANGPWALLVLRFLTCMGVGGMWPNGVALIAEAWPNVSRPILAGLIGTAANVGICCFAFLTTFWHVTGTDWRWTMLFGASPIVLGVLSWIFVPESPSWLNLQGRDPTSELDESQNDKPAAAGLGEIFKTPIRRITIIGILLGTVPLFGGWGVSNWATAWASEVGDKPAAKKADPTIKSKSVIARSLTGSISSLLGGALAFFLGRKRSYFLLSLCALVCTQFLFRVETPGSDAFYFWMGALGFFSGFFFGWLPLCLPELFPTRVRSTGAGVSFNWGRILTGIGILASAIALKEEFEGRYADVGKITGFIYFAGMVVILFAPDTSDGKLQAGE